MSTKSLLFTPLTLRGLTLKNRLLMAPMCQYSAVDGLAQPWHLQHYTERAKGGASLLIVEATAIEPRGRISPSCLGLWSDAHAEAFRPVVDAVHQAGAKIGVQIAHAGRKASTQVPWKGTGYVPVREGGWAIRSASPLAFDADAPVPEELTEHEIFELIEAFGQAARRAVEAGFDTIEIHAAHGYLIHQFLSPLSNKRNDAWGGDLQGRSRFLVEVTRTIRRTIPEDMPLLVRLSATDWVEGGWDVDQTVQVLEGLKNEGVDFADISSGGIVPGVKITIRPGYQIPLAQEVKTRTGLPTGAVGLITETAQAEATLANGQADAILLGRLLLRDPYFPVRNSPAEKRDLPPQYLRGFPSKDN